MWNLKRNDTKELSKGLLKEKKRKNKSNIILNSEGGNKESLSNGYRASVQEEEEF